MDAKEKAKRAEERTTRRVYDILKNHDQETRTIEAQIEAERAALEADLAEIRTRAYPRAVRYDTPRVQSSPDPDGNMVKIAAAIERRPGRKGRSKPWKNASGRSKTSTKSSWLWTRRRRSSF